MMTFADAFLIRGHVKPLNSYCKVWAFADLAQRFATTPKNLTDFFFYLN